jgi:tetratricopeptide (TPR) repeat protein
MVHGPTAVTEVSLPDSNAASTGESPTVRSVRLPPVDTVASVKRDGLGAPSLDRPFGKAPPNAMIDSYELQLAQLARQRVERGQVNESIDLVSNAVAKRPDSAFLYRLLGESYLRRGDYTLAEKAIQRSLGLNKSDAETNRLYAQVLFALGQHDRANHYRQRSADLVSMQSTENSPASTRGVGRID